MNSLTHWATSGQRRAGQIIHSFVAPDSAIDHRYRYLAPPALGPAGQRSVSLIVEITAYDASSNDWLQPAQGPGHDHSVSVAVAAVMGSHVMDASIAAFF